MPVRGIMPATGLKCEPPFKEYMEMMRISNVRVGLQLLRVQENELTRECGELSRGLLWLQWSVFGYRNIPQWLSLENIRVLSLSGCLSLESLWEDDHAPLELRELAIENCRKLRSLPRSIGYLKHLKRLVVTLNWTCELSSLPEEFCRLQSLEHLVLTQCEELSSLPKRFGDLVNLRHIDLGYCGRLNWLPVSFKKLIHLEYLNLSGCWKLTLKTDILDNMTNLKVFECSGCYELQVLPHNITSQASLTKLDLTHASSLRELPASIDQLSELKELLIKRMSLLTRLPSALGNMSNLITLRLVHCPRLYDMPSLAGLVSLNNLCVKGCPRIMKIEGLEHLRSLENLNVRTDWMVPGIHSLRCGERLPLRTLTLQAADISAFGACIESIDDQMEKWPCEMTLCGKFFASTRSILDNFMVVVKKMEHYNISYKYVRIAQTALLCEHTNPSDAAVVCFHVKCKPQNFDELIYIDGIESSKVRMSPGEWIVMTVLREVPLSLLTNKCLRLSMRYICGQLDVSSGWIIVGERGDVIAGFKQLFQTLCEASHK